MSTHGREWRYRASIMQRVPVPGVVSVLMFEIYKYWSREGGNNA
jgi:hypothetical protein